MRVVLTLSCRHQADIILILTEYLNAKVCFLLLWFLSLTVAEQYSALNVNITIIIILCIIHTEPPSSFILLHYIKDISKQTLKIYSVFASSNIFMKLKDAYSD